MTDGSLLHNLEPNTSQNVYAALAYYHANRDEIEADLAAQEAEAERLEAEYRAGKLS